MKKIGVAAAAMAIGVAAAVYQQCREQIAILGAEDISPEKIKATQARMRRYALTRKFHGTSYSDIQEYLKFYFNEDGTRRWVPDKITCKTTEGVRYSVEVTDPVLSESNPSIVVDLSDKISEIICEYCKKLADEKLRSEIEDLGLIHSLSTQGGAESLLEGIKEFRLAAVKAIDTLHPRRDPEALANIRKLQNYLKHADKFEEALEKKIRSLPTTTEAAIETKDDGVEYYEPGAVAGPSYQLWVTGQQHRGEINRLIDKVSPIAKASRVYIADAGEKGEPVDREVLLADSVVQNYLDFLHRRSMYITGELDMRQDIKLLRIRIDAVPDQVKRYQKIYRTEDAIEIASSVPLIDDDF